MSKMSKALLNSLKGPGVPWRNPEEIFVIAEIGINHNGDLSIAKNLIRLAHEAGCDAVKFQKRTIDIVYSPDVLDSPRDSPWGSTQGDQKNGLEFDAAQYAEIDQYCKSLGIEWSASAWDIPSLEFVEKFSPSFHKVASAMITHESFLEEVAKLGRLTLLSTGMADLRMVDKAVEIFGRHKTPVILMHTVSTYPTPEEHLNLAVLHSLRERYNLPVGYSGHEASVSPSLIAASHGAVVIERHITMDRAMYGSDQAASLDPQGVRLLVGGLRKVEAAKGNGIKKISDLELKNAKKMRYWE